MTTIPTSRILIALGLFVLFAGLYSIHWPFQAYEQKPTTSGSQVVATVGTVSITLREVEQVVALPLYQADQQRSQLLHQALQRKIEETLLTAEASRKGVSVSQLLAEASQSESVARLANLPGPVKQLSPDTIQDRPSPGASQDLQELARIRQALLVSLRRKADIHIALPPPEPPILTVSVDDDPSIGPVDAPVTIVEFSDFQCPYCQKSVGMLKELRRLYGEKLRIVYRDYPGPNHPYAPQAAEAAQCAGEQSRYWEYHDILFDRQTPGKGWDFPALARELGLQPYTFATCLNTGRYREEVAKDLHDGLTLGITSTPTFFINGRPLVGARPIAEFQAVIDRLLNQQPPS
ncbi:MAG TPA: thioredoxin domain-containing protein [Nitrospiraceae bacterium]|jgi:protein-disulfide isomerase|nr:thioredoxin domain-containing protein [Nitrospiraceae bacterium]